MSDDEVLEIGDGPSVFHDLGAPDADSKMLKAQLAAEIIKTLDREKLTLEAAARQTGVAAADISRIRNASLGRFTIDRLVRVLAKLDRKVELKVKPRGGQAAA